MPQNGIEKDVVNFIYSSGFLLNSILPILYEYKKYKSKMNEKFHYYRGGNN